MLVLSRNIGERIVIGDNIIVEILDVRGGNAVRLGISAPIETSVHRQEIWEAIQRERLAAEGGSL